MPIFSRLQASLTHLWRAYIIISGITLTLSKYWVKCVPIYLVPTPVRALPLQARPHQGEERLWQENLNLDNPGVSNYGGFYSNIDQINLMISKLNATSVVTPANKNYYLGICYMVCARFYYFQIYRTWGNAIIQTDPITGATLNIATLAKAASPQADVMTLIKADIDKSVASFGTDYTFRNFKGYWSNSATLMLKAEVYLWTNNHGGTTALMRPPAEAAH